MHGPRRQQKKKQRQRKKKQTSTSGDPPADETLTDVNISCSDLLLWLEGCCKTLSAVTSRVSGHEHPKVTAGSSVSKTGNYKTSDPTKVKINHTSRRMKTNVRHVWRFSSDKNDDVVICRLKEPGFVLTPTPLMWKAKHWRWRINVPPCWVILLNVFIVGWGSCSLVSRILTGSGACLILDMRPLIYSNQTHQLIHYQFLQRQKILGIYREMLRTIRQVPEEGDRKYLRNWARDEFKRNKSVTNQVRVELM